MMPLYPLALFMHLCGVTGLFGGLGALLFGVAALRRAERVEPVRLLAGLMIAAGNLAAGSIILLGIGGFYMGLTAWGLRATWLIVATVSFVLLAPGGLLVLDPRVRAIAKQARDTPGGPLPATLAQRTRDPILAGGLVVYVAVLLGIVFLMTNKPALGAAILAMGIAVGVGMLASLLLWWAARVRARPMVPTQSSHG